MNEDARKDNHTNGNQSHPDSENQDKTEATFVYVKNDDWIQIERWEDEGGFG